MAIDNKIVLLFLVGLLCNLSLGLKDEDEKTDEQLGNYFFYIFV